MPNILLSYPRSGNHLTRFFMELLMEQPTNGHPMNKQDKPIHTNTFAKPVPFNITKENRDNFIYHKHHAYSQIRNPEHLILLIRNPKEVILRQTNFDLKKLKTTLGFMYQKNIEYFNAYKGKKKIFFYEDMITDKETFLLELYVFLECENFEKLMYCIENIDDLYKLSHSPKKGRIWGGNKSHHKLNFYYIQSDKYNQKNFNIYLKTSLKGDDFNFVLDKYSIDLENL